MEDKIERLLHEVERLVMHLKHRVPPEVVAVDEIIRMVDEIRVERKEAEVSGENRDHWHAPETDQPEKEPGPHAQDKSRPLPTKERQKQYEKAGEAGRQTGETFKRQ